MDEDNYKSIRNDAVPISCAFEKSVLALRVSCSKSNRINIAERQTVQCESFDCQLQCETWLQVLRGKSLFSLQITNINTTKNVLPHAKEMKVQVGGVEGLASLLVTEAGESTPKKRIRQDVNHILTTCLEKYGQFTSVPFGDVVKSVVRFHLRKA